MFKNRNFIHLPEDEIKSSGFVVHTLEASIWCLYNSHSYEEAVLKAVNLGDDSDTTAAVTGGLAGLFFGFEKIPKKWMEELADREKIEKISEKLFKKLS